MDNVRKGFEVWAISDMGYMVARAGDGYKCDYMNTAWLSWKASRDALCVELPSFENGSIRGYSGDCVEARMVVDSVADSLGKAGVSYK